MKDSQKDKEIDPKLKGPRNTVPGVKKESLPVDWSCRVKFH